jgi:hypothetical protein
MRKKEKTRKDLALMMIIRLFRIKVISRRELNKNNILWRKTKEYIKVKKELD